jgi:hypothetical protein
MTESIKVSSLGERASRPQYIAATGIPAEATVDTALAPLHVRTVATSLTTGNLNLRYAPRSPKNADGVNTIS